LHPNVLKETDENVSRKKSAKGGRKREFFPFSYVLLIKVFGYIFVQANFFEILSIIKQ
jgi:hypothetical protein